MKGYIKKSHGFTLDGQEFKYCTYCDTWCLLSEFGTHKKSPDELRYLCKNCRNNYSGSILATTCCPNCGKLVHKPLDQMMLKNKSRGIFCNHKCYSEFLTKDLDIVGYFIECTYCGKITRRTKCTFHLDKYNGLYCSRKCVHKSQIKQDKDKNDRRKMGNPIRAWRNKVIQRDNFTCQICHDYLKGSKDLHAHHIKAWKDYPELGLKADNGISFCKDCHIWVDYKFDILAQQ